MPRLQRCYDMHQAELDCYDHDYDDVTAEANMQMAEDELYNVPFIRGWHADPQKSQQD